MSLAVALSDGTNLWVAADTRSYSVQDGPLSDPVEKIRLFHKYDRPILVCVAGESEIAGVHLFEHARNHLRDLFDYEGLHRFQASLFRAIENHLRTTSWDSKQEKEDFISSVHITLFLATSHTKTFVIDATYDSTTLTAYVPPRSIVAFGMPNLVQFQLEREPKSISKWPKYLASLFTAAAASSNYIAPPVDVVKWSAFDGPLIQRFNLEELRRG